MTMPKIPEDDELAALHKAIMDAAHDYRRPTPAARKAVDAAMDAYRAAWPGEGTATQGEKP